MRLRLMKSLTPHLGPESEGEVVGIELRPNEPSVIGKHGVRPSVSSSGFAFSHLLPLCVYVKFGNCLDWPFPEQPCEQPQITGADASCTELPLEVSCRAGFEASEVILYHRFAMAVALSAGKPKSITALHTLQGMTAQPGLKAHWSFPPNLPSKTKWLATYVMLSRPRVNYFLCSCATKGARNCAAISSIYVVHVHVAFFSLNELRFNEIMFCDCMVRDLMKSCFCKAPFKRASGLWNWRLAACTDKKGMAVWCFFAIGVVRWAKHWCFAFAFFPR